jgi:hypothetical protein
MITAARERFAAAPPADERASALKERIYASFTGLAIVVVIGMEPGHSSAVDALVTLAVGIVGIASAGFVADIIAHQVTHAAAPTRREIGVMARIAGGALASASVPLLALGSACFGWISLETAVLIGTVLYVVTLALIALLAVARTQLRFTQKLFSLLIMVGFCAVVVAVLLIAH